MKHPTARTILSLAALAVVFTAGLLAAGPLNPPPGPVASTYKTLSEVEPRIAINAANTPGDADSLFKITTRGSYYLTANVSGVAGKHGIEVTTSGVTIDLNGFDLQGLPAMGAFDGVSVTAAGLTDIVVLNGTVHGWGDDGVDLGTAAVANGRIDGIVADANGGIGISLGTGSIITRCTASGNTSHGIATSSICTVTQCSANDNGGSGIFAGTGCTVSDCASAFNTAFGINAGSGARISGCALTFNGNTGLVVGTACSISDCTCDNNAGAGISTGFSSTVTNCSAFQNSGPGIAASTGNTITACSAYDNGFAGISAGAGSTVADCSSRTNTGDGITVSSLCIVRDNSCSTNGFGGDGAGIRATSSANRIEGNNCTGADRGVELSTEASVVIRNCCSGNTIDWVIAANNILGPIIDRRASASAAISGFTAAGTLGSTDSNANFSY